ncbi:RDD family protein [Natranaerovirga hydrolytica]|uniref:RDD family protein n=1 Tax=Natranaerovirga hydrolytica TaxID=680378 RepID=A0A4R1M6T5_9FIRM|nr:RDD family protein [Natranaerovirga hydrolytica]TCK87986.1 RDD family protein [Natranaerovirga hydrolytica]
MLVKRIVSELIDIIIMFAAVVGVLYGLANLEFLGSFESGLLNTLALVSTLIMCIAVPILLQSLFWQEGRSIGKNYVGLVVVDSLTKEKVGFSTMLVREAFSKWLSLWIMCIPIFFGKRGVHENATQTEVRVYIKKRS